MPDLALAAFSSASAPIDSASGTLRSGRWNWYSGICSSRSRRRLPSQGLPQVLRHGRPHPAARPRPGQPALAGDDQVIGVGVQRLGDQGLADIGPVGVGRVDEVDSQFDGAAQRRLGPLPVRRLAPDAVAGDPHRAEAQPVDGEVPADVIVPAAAAEGWLATVSSSRGRLTALSGDYAAPWPRPRRPPRRPALLRPRRHDQAVAAGRRHQPPGAVHDLRGRRGHPPARLHDPARWPPACRCPGSPAAGNSP